MFCGETALTPAKFQALFRRNVLNSQQSQKNQGTFRKEEIFSERSSTKSLFKSDYLQKSGLVTRATLAADFSTDRCVDARRYEAFLESQEYDFNEPDPSDRKSFNFYDLYRSGRSTEKKRKYHFDSANLEDHSWHRFPKFPVKKISPDEIAHDARPLTTATRYRSSEFTKLAGAPLKDPALVTLDRLAADHLKESLGKSSEEIKYQDPTARYMGLCYPGRGEQKHIYDLKLNCKVYPDPVEDHIRFLQRKGDYIPKQKDQNYYADLGLIRLGKAAAKDRKSVPKRKSEVTNYTDCSHVENELCASIDRISRLRRDWKLFAADCNSRIDLSPSALLWQLLDEKSKHGLDLHEFVKLLRNIGIKAEPDQIDDAFRLIDTDKDKLIDDTDLRRLLGMKQLSPAEIRYGPSQYADEQERPLGLDFYEPFSHLLKCLLCVGENLRSIRLALTQLEEDKLPSDMSISDLKRRLNKYSHRHYVYCDDIDYIAQHIY